MEERLLVEQRINEIAGDAETVELTLEIIDEAYRGLEEGLSEGVFERIKKRLDDAVQEIEGLADNIREMIWGG